MQGSRCRLLIGCLVLVPCLGLAQDKQKIEQVPPIRLSKGIVVSPCDSGAPVAENPAFRSDVPCVEGRVELEHVSSPHAFRFLWYDPDGNLYASTKKDWTFKPAEDRTGYHKTAALRHRVSVKGEQASFLIGAWKVVAELDDAYLTEARFQIEDVPLPLTSTLEEARKLYLDLQYDRVLESLTSWLRTEQPKALQAEARWWIALSQNALGQNAEARQTLAELLQTEPTYTLSPEEAKSVGGEELRLQLEEIRKASYPDLYLRTGYPPQVELSRAEEAPVLGRRWPLWKKLLVYGGAPVAVGAGVFLLAGGGGDSGPSPLDVSASIQGSPDPRLRCIILGGQLQTVNVGFEVDVQGGTGNYDIQWDFDRTGNKDNVAPPTAAGVQRQQVAYAMRVLSDLGTYIVTVDVSDRDAPSLPSVRESMIVIIHTDPTVCQGI